MLTALELLPAELLHHTGPQSALALGLTSKTIVLFSILKPKFLRIPLVVNFQLGVALPTLLSMVDVAKVSVSDHPLNTDPSCENSTVGLAAVLVADIPAPNVIPAPRVILAITTISLL
jgi:hypothetical protein